jgi:hypothetical protein
MLFAGQVVVGLTLLTKLKWCSSQEQAAVVRSAPRSSPVVSRLVAWTGHGLGVAAAVTLIVWTVWNRLRWVRVEISAFPPETAASCSGEHDSLHFAVVAAFVIALYIMLFCCAWKQVERNNGIQRAGTMIICGTVIQAYLFGIPMLALVRGTPSPVAAYIVKVILIWTVAFTIPAALVWPLLSEIVSGADHKVMRFKFLKMG